MKCDEAQMLVPNAVKRECNSPCHMGGTLFESSRLLA